MRGLDDPHLAKVYEASRGPVAFIDESHDAVVPAGSTPFYTTAAVIVSRQQMDTVRAAITGLAGRTPWHTTEAFRAGRLDRIDQLAGYLAGAVDWNIVAAHAPMGGHTAADYAQARRSALAATLVEVTRGANPVQVVVLDTLGDQRADGADLKLGALLRGTGQIPHSTLLRHSDDRLEPLLGAPDLVAWATRRLLTLDDRAAYDRIDEVTTLLDARTGTAVDTRRLLAAVASPAAQGVAASFPPIAGASQPKRAMAAFLAQSAAAQDRQRAAGRTPRQGPGRH